MHGSDCTCEHNYEAIKTDCSFTGDAPPSGRCLDFGTCAAGRTSTINGVTTTILKFADFMRDCRDKLFFGDGVTPDARLPALEEFGLTCAATFTCTNGDRTMLSNKCDGVKHCTDGSDEGFQMCGSEYVFGNTGRAFRCINGNEVEAALECNGVCNCGNRATGMCEDEHPVRGDTTCAAQECARRTTSLLATCGGTWPASMLPTGEQKARCGLMCAPLLVELFADAACTAHLPSGFTAAQAADASRVCQFVMSNHVQPSFLCRDSAGLTVPIGQAQVCDTVNDCGSNDDEDGHTPTCPYLVATVNDCTGVARDPALLSNGVCDTIGGVQIFNCNTLGAGLDYDAGACSVVVSVESQVGMTGSVSAAAFIAAVAAANAAAGVTEESVQINSLSQVVSATAGLPVTVRTHAIPHHNLTFGGNL